jgi:Fur family transcriptional regulator, ferric uptake regulator
MTPADTLKTFGLRHTAGREQLLLVFREADMALSHGDVETRLATDNDRVTIYRTLKTFVEKGLLHKVLDDGGDPRYALCREVCADGQHRHDHVHFKCAQCKQTTCLDNVLIPAVALPTGYTRHETNLLIQGVCAGCNK